MKKITYSDSSYEGIITQLFNRFPSFQKQGATAYKPGLEHSFEICRRMGDPQKAYPCIHVAGTNGKGSTCNMLAAQFASRGLRVGLYTSPHILDFRERMRVISADGVSLISRQQVWDMIQRFDADFTDLDLSFFEITTALAFRFFADEKVDIAIIETGLGGRLDATNVITPILSVITNIGFDHTDLLGDTLPLIAAEKAGIIKPGIPVVIGESNPQTDPVFTGIAASNNAPITFADTDSKRGGEALARTLSTGGLKPCCSGRKSVGLSVNTLTTPGQMQGEGPGPKDWLGQACLFPDNIEGWEGLRAKPEGPGEACPSDVDAVLARMDLKGDYQQKNLRTVMAAMAVLGLETDWQAIENAARICDFHGRWEVLAAEPYTICDIGHNQHGLRYNFAQLEKLLEAGEYSDLVMVYGSVSDKDVDAVLGILPAKARIFFTAADNHRALPAPQLEQRAQAVFKKRGEQLNCCVCEKVPSAVEAALHFCSTLAKPLLYIGGSTYVVSEAVEFLNGCK